MLFRSIVKVSRDLRTAVERLRFGGPVACVYDPLDYAREPHEAYLDRYAEPRKEVLLVGMNPGPFGMAQTGVPFGDVSAVRNFLGITGRVAKPAREHPKRPILGFACPRSEVSGTRLWGFAEDRFGTAERFFGRFFVANYCPLVFMEASGKNLTPDKLAVAERELLFAACDRALRRTVEILAPRIVVGVGAFAEGRARAALPGFPGKIGAILHPSPASPKANRGWAAIATRELEALGVSVPVRRGA